MYSLLLGNESFKKSVKNMVNENRLVHSFIIEGSEGLGKHTAAKILSAAAICEGDAPCGKCRICKLCENLAHSDISVFKADGATFKIETVRIIREEAYIMPIEAKRKVFILENAEKMNNAAQNALLKILEEPPDSVIFILLTSSASLLLSTIRSRCLTLSLREVDFDEGAKFLQNNLGVEYTEAYSAIESTDGNLGKAKLILSDEDYKKQGETAAQLFQAISSSKYEFLKICTGLQNREKAKSVLEELKAILAKDLRKSSFLNNSTAVQKNYLIIEQINKSLETFKLNNNLTLTLTVLTENIFDIKG